MTEINFPFDFAGASNLAADFRATATTLDGQEGSRAGAARLPREQWQGVFATEFSESRLKTCLADTRSLATAMRNAAAALDKLSTAAHQEKAARQWLVDRMNGEHPAGPATQPYGEPPTYRATAQVASSRGAPSWGRLLLQGVYGKSSAVPEQLEAYVRTSQGLNDTLKRQRTQLAARYGAVMPHLGWGRSRTDLWATVDDLSKFIRLNDEDDRWVGTIAMAFRKAGGGGRPMTMDDEQIGQTLQDEFYSKVPEGDWNPLAEAAMQKLEQDKQRYGGKFPSNYYEEISRYMFEICLDHADGDYSKAMDLLVGLSGPQEASWAGTSYSDDYRKKYESVVGTDTTNGFDKVRHFSFTAWTQYRSGGFVAPEAFTYGKEMYDQLEHLFGKDPEGYSVDDIRADNKGEAFGEEVGDRASNRVR